MEIPSHILEAVQTASDLPRRRVKSAHTSPRKPSIPRFPRSRSARSSAEDLSTTSDSEQDHGYQTDFTSLPSDSSPEDMQPEDVEDFRDREYPQLKGKTYLDHGGTTLYARSLVEEFSADLIANLYGNPHSASSPSAVSGHRVDAIRERTLRFFNANPDEYDLVFVANATAAIKLVIECLKDYAASTNTPIWYGYHKDAHTSLVGVREATKMHRCFTHEDEVDTWINSGGFGGPRSRQIGLFAYPGQSNMTGRRLPWSWCGRIRRSFHKAATYTLLDAAALATTAPLDLSDCANAPDFVSLSFYKIFGFPNIGGLIVRKDAGHLLKARRFFGGGTVDMIISINDTWHAKKDTSIHDCLEDGTLPFHSIFALDHAMNVHERLYGPNPMKYISQHTAQLGKLMYDGLAGLKHYNGLPVCVIYKDDAAIYGDATCQGATIAFNIMKANGNLIGYEDVETAADERNIFVRSGSLCNPGGVASYLKWSPPEMRAAYANGHRCSNPTQIMFGRPTGVVRVSLGAMTTAADIRTLIRFLEETYVEKDNQPRNWLTYSNRMARTLSTAAALQPSSPVSTLPPEKIPALNSAASSPNLHASASAVQQQVQQPQQPMPPLPASSTPDNPPELTTDTPRPRFNPADYTKRYRPWEEAIRKTEYKTITNVSMEIKTRQPAAANSPSTPDSDSATRTTTPSVKARKFGRSVVNLLRTKSSVVDGSASETRPPPLPSGPLSQSQSQSQPPTSAGAATSRMLPTRSSEQQRVRPEGVS